MHINGIDEKDNAIINLLLKDARMSYSDISLLCNTWASYSVGICKLKIVYL